MMYNKLSIAYSTVDIDVMDHFYPLDNPIVNLFFIYLCYLLTLHRKKQG